MNKEEFEILQALLEKIIMILSKNNQFMPVYLILLGAVLSFVPQIIFWKLQIKKEKKEKIRELLAEAYKQTQSLIGYYKMLVMYKVHKNFWHQSSLYAIADPKKAEIYYSKHLESSKDAFITEEKIINLLAEYVKTLKSFQIYNGKIEMIEVILKELNDYKTRKPKTFERIPDPDLREAAIKEEEALNKEYSQYSVYFNSINKLMEKKLY